ncbi:metal-dependent transcriptional regulator [bacterium]|nr:MAG: metal-dependent transcriptional regulator [bacterium]
MSQTAKSDLLGRAPLSSAVEDYLKAIYALREDGETVVSTQSLANRLGVAPPSATAMLKKLDGLGLAHHEPYRGVALSPAGEKIALEVVRHHRIIETFLAEILGLSWDKVHDEAERLEHVISEEVEAKMAAVLGHPTHDPHGSPIPALDGALPNSPEARLCDLKEGWTGKVTRVADENGDVLRHLSDLGLRPGSQIEVIRAVAAEGVLKLQVAGEERIVGIAPARAVWVNG